MKILISIIGMVIITKFNLISAEINMTEFFKMPPLYLLDDYDRCMDEYPNIKSTYCYARTLIKPNESSEIWRYIKNYSDDHKHHFRHDRLNRGVCLNWCKDRENSLGWDRYSRRKFNVENWSHESEITFDPNSFQRALEDRAQYGKLFNRCVNYNLRKEYNLEGYSSIEYCVSNTDQFETDALDISFVIFILLLVALLILSTIYDFRLKQTDSLYQDIDHYKNPINGGKMSAIIVSFSIPRNWYRLNSKPDSDISTDLRSIHAIRFLTMLGVIIGHVLLFYNVLPSFNPQEMEKNYYRFETMFFINGPTIIQTFFGITGYLLSVQFMKLRKTQPFSIHYLWKPIIYRYIRLSPIYFTVIFLHATWLNRAADGPLWLHSVDTERTFCRNNWWANVLYINNYFTTSEPCVQHGWYLASDLQLFTLGVFLHVLFWKFPKCTNIVLGIGILISNIIPGVLTWIFQLEGAYMVLLENQRYAHWYDIRYKFTYIPAYCNIGSFLCGMIGGMLYSKYREEKIEQKRHKLLVWSWYVMHFVGLAVVMSGYIFYENDFEKPSVWMSVYSALTKNLWGIYGSIIITGMAFGVGWKFRNFMCHPIFRILGRLTFCAYLIHPTLIRIQMGNIRQPLYNSTTNYISSATTAYFQAYLAALIICLFMEMPISALQRQFTQVPSFTEKSVESGEDDKNRGIELTK